MARLVKKQAQQAQAEPDFLADTRRIAELAAEHKALNVKAYDVRELTVIADSFVICSANSEPHMKAVLNAVRNGMREMGQRPLNTEGEASASWLILDYGSTIFHLFRVEAREFYDLDGLWADAPEIALNLD